MLGKARLFPFALIASTRETWLVVCGSHGQIGNLPPRPSRPALLQKLCALQWVHVDSHTGDELNDRADGLAALGGNGWTKALDGLPSETGGAFRDLPGDLGGA